MNPSLYFYPSMKKALPIFLCILTYLLACKKESVITSPDARIFISADTVRFDTVFTTAGSVTASFKIFNLNESRLNISSIALGGGGNSAFRINADGTPGPQVRDLEIAGGDSMYVFVTVNVNPNANTAPFLITDSIQVQFNGKTSQVQLTAYGQNARYIRGEQINASTTWDNTLPYVIIGGVQITRGNTLTINPGTRIYLHADAPFIVDGTLRAIGTKKDSIVFQGDRLDKEYRDLPASWPGIYFRETSQQNQLSNVIIKNAFQGVVAIGPSTSFPKLSLDQCTLDNIYDAGIYGINSQIRAVNCLISNSGMNILVARGGRYEFTHCTVASYANVFIPHTKPVCILSNWDSTTQINSFDLSATLTNNIFWGENGNVDDEILISKRGNNIFNVTMENNLYKAANPLTNATLLNNLVNQPPLFDSIGDNSRYFDFRINKGRSPAINKGKAVGVAVDRDGLPRNAQPDMGSFEKQ
jgi:hypothetical protein